MASSAVLKNLKVVIAGAGIGGLSAAIALRLKGASVTICEQAHEMVEVGAGLQVQPSATRVINAFGLKEKLAAIGRVPHSLTLREARTGRIIIPAGRLIEQNPDAMHYQVHRADLQTILYERALALGAKVELNAGVVDLRQKAAGASIVLQDGRELYADVVVGADGVKSVVRQSLFGAEEPVFTGNVAFRMMVDAGDIRQTIEPGIIVGPDSHVVVYPLRQGEIVNLIAQQRSDSWQQESWTSPADVTELRAFYRGWDPVVDVLLENVTEAYKWALYSRPAMSAWSRGNIVLIGDACHPTLPNLGAGAAMAIEDAYVLADLLAQYPQNLPDALALLHKLRINRCTRIQQESKRNADFFHISNPLERLVKYGGVSAVSRLMPRALHRRLAWLRDYDATAVVSDLS